MTLLAIPPPMRALSVHLGHNRTPPEIFRNANLPNQNFFRISCIPSIHKRAKTRYNYLSPKVRIFQRQEDFSLIQYRSPVQWSVASESRHLTFS